MSSHYLDFSSCGIVPNQVTFVLDVLLPLKDLQHNVLLHFSAGWLHDGILSGT